jgi:hypothetical protein
MPTRERGKKRNRTFEAPHNFFSFKGQIHPLTSFQVEKMDNSQPSTIHGIEDQMRFVDINDIANQYVQNQCSVVVIDTKGQ